MRIRTSRSRIPETARKMPTLSFWLHLSPAPKAPQHAQPVGRGFCAEMLLPIDVDARHSASKTCFYVHTAAIQ